MWATPVPAGCNAARMEMWEDRVGPCNYTHTQIDIQKNSAYLRSQWGRKSFPFRIKRTRRAELPKPPIIWSFYLHYYSTKAPPCFYRAKPMGLGSRRRSAWTPRGLTVGGLGELISKLTHKNALFWWTKGEIWLCRCFCSKAQIPGNQACNVYWHSLQRVCHTCSCAHSKLLNQTELSIGLRKWIIVWPIIYSKI